MITLAKDQNKNRLFQEILEKDEHLLTIKDASIWATNHLRKNVTTSNISYLIQYGRIRRIEKNGATFNES